MTAKMMKMMMMIMMTTVMMRFDGATTRTQLMDAFPVEIFIRVDSQLVNVDRFCTCNCFVGKGCQKQKARQHNNTREQLVPMVEETGEEEAVEEESVQWVRSDGRRRYKHDDDTKPNDTRWQRDVDGSSRRRLRRQPSADGQAWQGPCVAGRAWGRQSQLQLARSRGSDCEQNRNVGSISAGNNNNNNNNKDLSMWQKKKKKQQHS